MFKTFSVQLLKPLSHKEKLKPLLHAIESDWYMKTFNDKISPLKNQKLNKINKKSIMK